MTWIIRVPIVSNEAVGSCPMAPGSGLEFIDLPEGGAR